MGEFFSQRLSRHFKKMSKYLRYILNDHFVLVCMFLLGGLGLYYSQLLKELPRDFVWGRPLILLGWLLLIQVGKLATLTEEPDKVFLLPKEKQFAAYLKRALRYSLLLPIVVSFLGSWPIDAVDCSHNRLVVSNLLFIFGHASLYDLYTS